LETTGTLARNELKKDDTRDLLLSFLSHPKELIRIASITALGNLEDPRAIAMLETFSAASSYRPEKAPAESALVKIRAARRPSEELKSLRSEFSNLQDASREFKKDLDKLRQQVEGKP
jgi:HEAT repeat protein